MPPYQAHHQTSLVAIAFQKATPCFPAASALTLIPHPYRSPLFTFPIPFLHTMAMARSSIFTLIKLQNIPHGSSGALFTICPLFNSVLSPSPHCQFPSLSLLSLSPAAIPQAEMHITFPSYYNLPLCTPKRPHCSSFLVNCQTHPTTCCAEFYLLHSSSIVSSSLLTVCPLLL